MDEPAPAILIADLLAWARGLPLPDRGEPPLWRWQRWMGEAPDHAWKVLQGLVLAAPDDAEVIDHAARQCELLLSIHWDRFAPRAIQLVRGAPLLDAMVGPEVLTAGHYQPRYRTLEELAGVWLTCDAHATGSNDVDQRIDDDAETGLRVALEIVQRGSLHGFESWEVHGPLLRLLQHHGALVVDRVVAAAAASEALRRTIWECRRLNPTPDEPYGVTLAVWHRFQAAAGGTTSYNTPRPEGARTTLGAELDALLDHWFAREESFWAYNEVDRLVDEEPERGWAVIREIVRQAPTEEARCTCGCGPLEDLIRRHPAEFVDRIELAAATDAALADALACAWLTLEDVPEPLARRYFAASGNRLRILDAPPGWPASAAGGSP